MSSLPGARSAMSGARLLSMSLALLAVAAGSWLLVRGFDVKAMVAVRAGCGCGVAVALGFLLPVLLPKKDAGGTFARVVGARPEEDDELPASLRDLEFACRFAIMPTGAYDLHFRLRPVLRDLADHRLRSGHGVDLDAAPVAAQALLGQELWELVRPGRPAPEDKRGPGLSPEALVEIVKRLESL